MSYSAKFASTFYGPFRYSHKGLMLGSEFECHVQYYRHPFLHIWFLLHMCYLFPCVAPPIYTSLPLYLRVPSLLTSPLISPLCPGGNINPLSPFQRCCQVYSKLWRSQVLPTSPRGQGASPEGCHMCAGSHDHTPC